MKGIAKRRAANLLIFSVIALVINQGALAAPGDISTFAGAVTYQGSEVRDFDTLNSPSAVIVDHTNSNNRIIVDSGNHRLRLLTPSGVSTVANITTGRSSSYSGLPPSGHAGDGGPAIIATFSAPVDAAFDSAGNLYIADSHNHRIRKIDAVTGIITTAAGDGFKCPGTGSDTTNYCQIQDDTNPVTGAPEYEPVSGRGRFNGDGMPATQTSFSQPHGLAIDSQSNIYVADRGNHRIRKIDGSTGLVSTVAGTLGHLDQGEFRRCGDDPFPNGQTWPPLGDGGLAVDACLAYPSNVTLSGNNLYFSDTENHRIRVVNLSTGIVDTVAGSGCKWKMVQYFLINGAVVTASVNDAQNRPCSHSHSATTFAGPPGQPLNGNQQTQYTDPGGPGDGVTATAANLAYPKGIRVDSSGNLYIADTGIGRPQCPPRASPSVEICAGNRVRKVDASSGIITTIAGNGQDSNTTNIGDGGPATSAQVNQPHGLLLVGNTFEIAEAGNTGPVPVTNCGTGTNPPCFDGRSGKIRRVDGSGTISTIAGTRALLGCCIDDGLPVSMAFIQNVRGLAVAPSGDTYLSDTDHHRIVKVSASGIVSTVAGDGTALPFATMTVADGSPATGVELNYPRGVTLDSAGNLYIADTLSHKIRKVSVTGTITTVAGKCSPSDFGCAEEASLPNDGDKGPAVDAWIRWPFDVAVDAAGNLFIAEPFMQRIRKVDTNGIITTVAGSGDICPVVRNDGIIFPDPFDPNYRPPASLGPCGRILPLGSGAYTGDKLPTGDAPLGYGLATEAKLNFPMGVEVDSTGNLYIADTANHKIRKVDSDGWITTVAGSGVPGPAFLPQQIAGNTTMADRGSLGDGLQATLAPLMYPHDVIVDGVGNMFIADTYNARVRRVDSGGIITTFAGNGCHPGWGSCTLGDGGPAIRASLRWPVTMALKGSSMLIAEAESENLTSDQMNSFMGSMVPAQVFTTCQTASQPFMDRIRGGVPFNCSTNSTLVFLGFKSFDGRAATNNRVRLVAGI